MLCCAAGWLCLSTAAYPTKASMMPAAIAAELISGTHVVVTFACACASTPASVCARMRVRARDCVCARMRVFAWRERARPFACLGCCACLRYSALLGPDDPEWTGSWTRDQLLQRRKEGKHTTPMSGTENAVTSAELIVSRVQICVQGR